MPSGYNILDPTLGMATDQRDLLENSNQAQQLDDMRGTRYVDRAVANYQTDQHFINPTKWTLINPTLTLVIPDNQQVRSIITVNIYMEMEGYNTALGPDGNPAGQLVLYDSLEAFGVNQAQPSPMFLIGTIRRSASAYGFPARVDGWESFAYFGRPGTHVINLGVGAFHGNDNIYFHYVILEGNIL